jgi:hypothetical protein
MIAGISCHYVNLSAAVPSYMLLYGFVEWFAISSSSSFWRRKYSHKSGVSY